MSSLILSAVSLDKRKQLTSDLVDHIRASNTPLLGWAQLKAIEDAIGEARDVLRSEVVDVASQYSSKEKFKHFGVDFQVKEAGVKYDFSDCNDPVYNDLIQQQAELKERIKGREAFLKSLKTKHDEVDISTGEILYTIYPPKKRSTTTVVVELG